MHSSQCHVRTCAASGLALGYFGGEHLQHFNASGFHRKNFATASVCKAEVVNLCIAFGPRQNTQAPALKLRKS
jgi:hypothetical protein